MVELLDVAIALTSACLATTATFVALNFIHGRRLRGLEEMVKSGR